MFEYIELLYDDVQQNRKLLETNDSQLARRNYLRSLSAFYELILSNLRETTAKLLVDEFELSGEWKLHDIYPLLDETARLSENGLLKLDINRQPFLPLVAYTLKTYAKQIGFGKEVLSDYRWKAFCESIKIRHRITHPKLENEIVISDDELITIDRGWDWWNDILRELRNAHRNKLMGN